MSLDKDDVDAIVGLGHGSARKSYYPQLKQTIETLESTVETQAGLLSKQSTLLHELHHRVRNNLQVILSMLSLERGATIGSELPTEAASRRIAAMASAYDHFLDVDEYRSIDLISLILAIVSGARRSYDESIEFLADNELIGIRVHVGIAVAVVLSDVLRAWKETGGPSLRVSIVRGAGAAASVKGEPVGSSITISVRPVSASIAPESIPEDLLFVPNLMLHQIDGARIGPDAVGPGEFAFTISGDL